jgi:hypothetical protein
VPIAVPSDGALDTFITMPFWLERFTGSSTYGSLQSRWRSTRLTTVATDEAVPHALGISSNPDPP